MSWFFFLNFDFANLDFKRKMNPHTSYSDHELVTLFRQGDELAFAELYNRHHDRICRFIRKYLKSEELSEDICQNVFIKIWEQKDQVDIIEFGAYAFTLAKRQALDFLKRAAIEEAALGLILLKYSPRMKLVEDEHQNKEYTDFVEDVLSRLPEQSRTVFKLCRQQYKTYDEAAELLGISRNTVKKHMMRSMKVLKDAAEGELGVKLSVLLVAIATKL